MSSQRQNRAGRLPLTQGREAVSGLAPARAVALALSLLSAMTVDAQQLPLRCYNVSDGLPNPRVISIRQDAKGYLWLGTWEGLSRFDGYAFVNYGTRDGLGHVIVNHITEDRQGRLWVATNGGGVARLADNWQEAAGKKFISFPVGDAAGTNRVNRILFDAENNLWAATDAGLYRAAPNARPLFELVVGDAGGYALFADRRGRLWVGLGNELIEVSRSQVVRHGAVPGSVRRKDVINSILETPQGGLLVANWLGGLFEFDPPTEQGRQGRWRKSSLRLKAGWGGRLFEDSAGVIWLGTNGGLFRYQNGRLTEYTTAQGLGHNEVTALAEDLDGNLWVGTYRGVCKFGGELIVNYPLKEGKEPVAVIGVYEDDGVLKALISGSEVVTLAAGKVSRSAAFEYPPIFRPAFWIRRNRKGVWYEWENLWGRFRRPVLRLRGGRELPITDIVSSAEELSRGVLFYEDETGKLWFSKGDGYLYRADPAQQGRLALEKFSIESGEMQQMVSDRAGGIWLATGRHNDAIARLGRLRQGQYVRLQPVDGLPEIDPRSLFVDSRGWLWVGMRFSGVSVTKDPAAEHPVFIHYSTENGLSSDTGWAITEDDEGRIYVATGKGLNRFDPQTGRWQIFAAKDGLASDSAGNLYKDRQGNIWVATDGGVSRFNPRAERKADRPAPVYLSRINIAGEDQPLAETGATETPPLELSPSRNSLTIEFVGLQFHGEDNLKYQYRLEGVDTDWSGPTKNRSVNYARLAPGAYRFLVRAINKEGMPSRSPAFFQFRILPPLWQRWWFLALTAALLISAALALYRYRLARILELANVRTRIATDLHDDIGANLTKIAILSEVVKQQLGNGKGEKDDPLSSIARISRESVAAMSDIVWAVNPRRDSLRDLVRRMRRHAEEVFVTRDIRLDFAAPEEEQSLKLGVDVRRDLFLIFKEAVNNAVRHSGCSQVAIDLVVTGQSLELEINDNGVGFDPKAESDGQGLTNMRERARKLGGELELTSEQSGGTRIRIHVPYARTARLVPTKHGR